MKKFKSYEITDKGKIRENNEDYFIKRDEKSNITKKYGKLFIICDGIGGHAGGEVASKLACEKFLEIYYLEKDKFKKIEERIEYTINQVNTEIYEYSNSDEKMKGMGTTIVGLIIKDKLFYVFNVGDCKCFLIRKNRIEQISEDHTLINEYNKLKITENLNFINKNIITRALGIDKNVKPFISKGNLLEEDKFILCSDGLTNHLNKEEILKIVNNKKIKDKVKNLVDLTNERGGTDNITIIYVFNDTKLKKIFKNLFITLFSFLIIYYLLSYFLSFKKILIDSYPRGAYIFINNELIAKTPFNLKFKNEIDFKLIKDGYKNEEIKLISYNKNILYTSKISEFKNIYDDKLIIPLKKLLKIEIIDNLGNKIDNFKIIIDGNEYNGKEVYLLLGRHNIIIEKDGYKNLFQEININENSNDEIIFVIEKVN
ncbi:MAG: Stp1/IreP family PP2C-type Ser/Thr phosphatase [Caldisericia bacterium]